MGLFSNSAKPCPICGKATPRLLAKKIGGEAICSKCADNIAADDVLVQSWSINDLKEHINYRDENQKLLKNFTPTRTVNYEHEFVIDDNKKLFFVSQWGEENPPVFRFEDVQGFEMSLGYNTVESWSRGMKRTPYSPPALGLASGISMLAEAFGGTKGKENDRFENLLLILKVNTKYLKEYELCNLSICGDTIAEYEHSFAEELARANIACNCIISIASGGTATAAASPTPAAAVIPLAEQAADNIRKFKELLDAGIITQEEFDAKKKQLLGI
ncbi:MAG: SHOCT domain-containing protein [Hydrogenoanaerobacterium sp.]